ncbi:MAG: hypothetical protein KAU62_04375 [Candidatus Heimdallarchaeota archaeon]|nr:hypothetical protein [Candidatus Heimdallarchaeota archaeon]MCG3255301.1 hypothetical protein [Candidatus Heimdallarchaeota archaeon]MCK4610374.1 hypothetical protein [Candidatus Heimdallarchaeota archaeon]
MASKKNASKWFIVLSLAFLLYTSSVVSSASNTSIFFCDMNMELDDVNDYEGIKLIVFFLPTCPSCIDELLILEQIDANYNLTIFMLDVYKQTTNQRLIDYKNNHTLSDDWIIGYSTSETNSFFDLYSVPTLVIIDDLGRVVALIVGQASYSFLETKILDAINHNTDNYNTEYNEDPSNQITAIFIIVGVGITAVVTYFLVKTLVKR